AVVREGDGCAAVVAGVVDVDRRVATRVGDVDRTLDQVGSEAGADIQGVRAVNAVESQRAARGLDERLVVARAGVDGRGDGRAGVGDDEGVPARPTAERQRAELEGKEGDVRPGQVLDRALEETQAIGGDEDVRVQRDVASRHVLRVVDAQGDRLAGSEVGNYSDVHWRLDIPRGAVVPGIDFVEAALAVNRDGLHRGLDVDRVGALARFDQDAVGDQAVGGGLAVDDGVAAGVLDDDEVAAVVAEGLQLAIDQVDLDGRDQARLQGFDGEPGGRPPARGP